MTTKKTQPNQIKIKIESLLLIVLWDSEGGILQIVVCLYSEYNVFIITYANCKYNKIESESQKLFNSQSLRVVEVIVSQSTINACDIVEYT